MEEVSCVLEKSGNLGIFPISQLLLNFWFSGVQVNRSFPYRDSKRYVRSLSVVMCHAI